MPGSLPSVVLVGRPNVGKSTLFNRVTRTRRAIVTSIPGTTRDVLAQPVEWEGTRFELTDTGGMFGASEDPLHALVLERGRRAIGDADLLVLVVDGREGLVGGDREIAKVIREAGKPALLAINKIDDKRARSGALEMYQLGFDPVFEIAAEHGDGVGDLLDAIVRELPASGSSSAPKPSEVAVGDRRASECRQVVAGQSVASRGADDRERDAGDDSRCRGHDADVASPAVPDRRYGRDPPRGTRQSWRPGGRRSACCSHGARSNLPISLCSWWMRPRARPIRTPRLPARPIGLGRGIIIVANKWDLMKERGQDFVKGFDEELRRQLKFLDYATILHISALTGERTPKLLEAIDKVAESRQRRVKTTELNKFVERVAAEHPPASPGRGHVRILYAAQTERRAADLRLFYQRRHDVPFLVSAVSRESLREEFGFEGTPIRLHVRARRRERAPLEVLNPLNLVNLLLY